MLALPAGVADLTEMFGAGQQEEFGRTGQLARRVPVGGFLHTVLLSCAERSTSVAAWDAPRGHVRANQPARRARGG
ncbi:hypothetical protein ACQEV9_00240 [Streptomyces chartreusis]|uniref:hypothetical protein n=1 Tax=Streptomyces chartreusis TaxID=1969 RepID=UPI003D90441C